MDIVHISSFLRDSGHAFVQKISSASCVIPLTPVIEAFVVLFLHFFSLVNKMTRKWNDIN
jgi:hypothetical protein